MGRNLRYDIPDAPPEEEVIMITESSTAPNGKPIASQFIAAGLEGSCGGDGIWTASSGSVVCMRGGRLKAILISLRRASESKSGRLLEVRRYLMTNNRMIS
jgi:hypothetical protein